jgi:hypothetical protein
MNRTLTLLVLAFLLGAAQTPARTEDPRQSYSAWRKHAEKPYYYRWYYFKPSADDKEPQYHYGIYYPSRGKRVYFFNPSSRKFWGYYDMEAKGYSLLPPEKRRERIDDIPAEAFPRPGKMPPLPDSTDGTTMLEPPDDLPRVTDLPD